MRGEIERAVRNGARSHHERYLDIFDLMQRRNRHMPRLFDDLRRSRALTMLAQMRSEGLLTEEVQSPGFAKDLWDGAQQSYSLDPVMGERKFGPHHVVVRTALSNIRITTFFAGESEVKIVDPSRIRAMRAVGSEVQFISPTEP